MLSALPKLADRGFILGFFLPSLLFVVALLGLFSEHPAVCAVLNDLTGKDLGRATFVLVGVWLLGVLVLMVNHPLYQMLEGYTWPLSRATGWKVHNQQRLAEVQADLRARFDRIRTEGGSDEEKRDYAERTIALHRNFPSLERRILPTAFGNAIKAFETYPNDIYGADGVPIWLRLTTVLPKEFAAQVQDLRNQVDFLVNGCMFSAVFGVVALVMALVKTPWALWFDVAGDPCLFFARVPWGAWCWPMISALLSWGFYCWAVSRVPAWGESVMTAFDCYLPDLATKLGYELPPTSVQRRAFWRAFGLMVVYREDPEGNLPVLEYLAAPTLKRATPSDGAGSHES
jgi:hypothetical protein